MHIIGWPFRLTEGPDPVARNRPVIYGKQCQAESRATSTVIRTDHSSSTIRSLLRFNRAREDRLIMFEIYADHKDDVVLKLFRNNKSPVIGC